MAMGYAGAYSRGMQWAPPMGVGGMQPPPGGGSWIGPQATRPLAPLFGGGQMPQMGGGQGGGWADALSGLTGWGDMEGMERAYMLASVGGGVADFFERKGERDEERRRYEQALAESRRHREGMGRNLNAQWGR